MKKKVLLGMSGGIDSSVSAMLLQDRGFQVMGISFIFSDNEDVNDHNTQSAKMLARILGIRHLTIDLRKEFNDLVVNYFINSYQSGITPFPCAVCNPRLKFFNLEKYADKYSCDFISTGHYVKITEYQGIKYISSAKDPEKDQSFFLWGLRKKLLERLIFPLGEMHKQAVRECAATRGFPSLSEKAESLGVCFVKGNNYRKLLINNNIEASPGNFTDIEGNVLGKHKGIFHYTIGQRRGLGINVNKPLFVSEIRADTNEVVLAGYGEMYRSRIFLQETRFVESKSIDRDRIYTVKIRYRLQENRCNVIFLSGQKAIIELQEPVAMVANGQTAVVYDKNRVVGGGFIEGSE
jgi:tRNA-uridine 2-sulfurtransferase